MGALEAPGVDVGWGSVSAERCSRCGRAVPAGKGFAFSAPEGPVRKCRRCGLRHPPMLRRSLATCLLVGTVLTAINQGTAILGVGAAGDLLWKVPLTYCVPFLVATWGALSNSRA